MSLGIFPWDRGEKPYFTNPEGFEWYIDKTSTKYAHEDVNETLKGIDVICFLVAKDGKLISYVIVDRETNEQIYDTESYEQLGAKIDMIKAYRGMI